MSDTITGPIDSNKCNRKETNKKREDVGAGGDQSPLAREIGAVNSIKVDFGVSFENHVGPILGFG